MKLKLAKLVQLYIAFLPLDIQLQSCMCKSLSNVGRFSTNAL